MKRLTRQKMIDAAEFYYSSSDEARSEVALYHLMKTVPHVENARDLGINVPHVMIPLMLEYPRSRLHEMVWETHRDAPAEEIVAELYRREAAGRAGEDVKGERNDLG